MFSEIKSEYITFYLASKYNDYTISFMRTCWKIFRLYKSLLKELKTTYILSCILVVFVSCNNSELSSIESTNQGYNSNQFNSEVVVNWFNLMKKLTTETSGYTPPVAARAFGYTGIALYEGIQLGTPEKESLSNKLNELNILVDFDDTKVYHWSSVANTILGNMISYFYDNATEANKYLIDDLRMEYKTLFAMNMDNSILERSITLGNQITSQIIEWSELDGGLNAQFSNFPDDYTPMQGDEFWKPTAPDFLPALQPYWGTNRPFMISNVENVNPLTPPEYSTDENSVFYQRALSVYEAVNNVSTEGVIIAEFWSDDPETSATPPGHSIAILNQLIEENDFNLMQASEAFAMLAIGINDAFISCWKTKYSTNYIRPITFINNYIDPNWTPILVTPPFPEYTSGHSVQSGVLAKVLSSIFGDNYSFMDKTHMNRTDIDGTPRSFENFIAMAEEAAISRLYGGIHYQEAIDNGLEQGYAIGNNVIELFQD
ncbi:PAP2 superfamily protein [Tenacibaculum sp. MAR_2009_124]|uniref:vanadium-dependent haloperoxidase n=1 Tax=Tenacibaculum sp. MAR_2009_124 TaxID=1250059 RepID=UPI0008996551|nr:vanadium-dependent haloperoxidase [Tenacibaculum sp. MAR_2009_124]SEB47039.1 PAP2 superfamily protein [Tenacibaculum sp. MAR_2009_124]